MSRTAAKRPTQSTLEAASAAVEAERTKLADLQSRLADTQAKLTALEQSVGGEVLDTPDAEDRLARAMQELRDRIFITQSAIATQGPRITAAEAAWLEAQAVALQPSVAELEAKVTAHEARTAELLAELEKHDGGPYIPEAVLTQAMHVPGQETRWAYHHGDQLRDQLRDSGLPVLVLKEMAAGRDPQVHPDVRGREASEVYPVCVWGPDALVKAPAYVRSVEHQQAQEASTRTALARVEARIVELEAAIECGEPDPIGMADWTLAQPLTLKEELVRRQRAREDLAEKLEPAAQVS